MPSQTERVRLTSEEKQALERFSTETGMSKSAIIRKALQDYIEDFPVLEIKQGRRTDLDSKK